MVLEISSEVQLALVAAVVTTITTVVSAAVAILRIAINHFDQKWDNDREDQEDWRRGLGHRLDLVDARTSVHFAKLNGTVQKIKDWAEAHEDVHKGLPSRTRMPWDSHE